MIKFSCVPVRVVLAAAIIFACGAPPREAAAGSPSVPESLARELRGKLLEQPSPGLETTEQGSVASVGPDVTIIYLDGIDSHSSGEPCPDGYGTGDCRGYSIGTDSCNVGSVPVDWCDQAGGCRTTTDEYHPVAPATVTDHSVIAQNLYRLKDGRFEQIGQSFLKHGFVSTNSFDSECVGNNNGTPTTCISPPAGGDQLGLGCTDFYGPGLNGNRPLGRRSDVNAASADHPENPAGGEVDDGFDQRIVVAETDLDGALNPGALYWAEGQYVVRDDARSGSQASPPAPAGEGTGTLNAWLGENGLNNASYRAVNVSNFNLSFTGPTVREKAAIYAWQEVDPLVEIVTADRQTFFPGDAIDPPATPGNHPDHWVVERFHVARRVTVTEGSMPYHYEYAIHNLNSDTAADGFVISFPSGAGFANAGFHDVDHHSGEPYDTTDWSISDSSTTISWSAVDAGANTNALRWGTTFSFWFDSDMPPDASTHQLDLFKIEEMLDVPLPTVANEIFSDGFEFGLAAWDQTTQ